MKRFGGTDVASRLKKCIFFGVSRQAVLLISASRLKHSKVVLDIIELYEVPGGNLVDGLPPAPSSGAVTGLVGPKNLDGLFADFGSVENYVCKI